MTDLGAVVTVAVDVRSAAGTLTDPSTATLTVTLPDGTTVTPAVTLPSAVAGQLRVDYATVQAGRHSWRMVTTGPITAYVDVFDVREALPPGIVSLKAAKDQLNIDPSATKDDEEIRGYIASSTRAVEIVRGEVVARRTFTDRSWVSGTQTLLNRTPVIALVSVAAVDGSTSWSVSPSVLDVDPDSGMVTVLSGPPLRGFLKWVYQAGYVIVPDAFQLAALIIIQHLWETQRGQMGVQLGGEGEVYIPGLGFAIPRRAVELLGSTLPGLA